VRDFLSSTHVEAWLRDKPRQWTVVIAARAALRAAPALATAIGPRGGGLAKAGRDIILPAFHGLCVSWVAAAYATHSADLAYAASDAYATTSDTTHAAIVSASARAAYSAIAYAAYVASTDVEAEYASSALAVSQDSDAAAIAARAAGLAVQAYAEGDADKYAHIKADARTLAEVRR
jgi:hypothetical protein